MARQGGKVFPKGLGNITHLLKQAMDAKAKIEEIKESLGSETIEASAGGGMVKVTLNGRFEMLSMHIDAEVINPEDPETLETLVRAAVNEGVHKVQELVRSKMTEVTGGIEIPGLM